MIYRYFVFCFVICGASVANGETSYQTQAHLSAMSGELEIDCDLDKVDLPEAGKRAGVQAVTAARHPKLLQALKEAKTESEKVDAAKKLEANYRAHYAVETEWRLKSLAELEKRLEEMRAQLKERAASEEKYVEAAMTPAKLHALGIAAEPRKLKGSSSQGGLSVPSPQFTDPAPVLPMSTSSQ